ncbi:MAG: VWD domain-containing protein [Gemmatimonadota bacterium]|nr:MAG: VWD domain-containing protein [Gemmatimonadota bacterium]
MKSILHGAVVILTTLAIGACGDRSNEMAPVRFAPLVFPSGESHDYVVGVVELVSAAAGEITYAVGLYDTLLVQSFALPGERLGLTRGMLNLMSTEAELACVIAHEIAHHELGHVRSRFGETAGIERAQLPDVLDALARGWSESEEGSADQLGATLCARAGYNPLALAHLLYQAALLFREGSDPDGTTNGEVADFLIARTTRLLGFQDDNGLRGGRMGSREYAYSLTAALGSARGNGKGLGAREGRHFFHRELHRGHVPTVFDLPDVYEEGRQATRGWIAEQCKPEGVNTLPSNYFDAFGHCWYGCKAARICGGRCGNPGIWYEIGRELGVTGGDEHDSFWQDWRNQNVGASRRTREGSCYGVCAHAMEVGGLDLTAPKRKWLDCETGDLLPERPQDAFYPEYLSSSYGDPHITTADGVHYSYQAAGEFIALKSTTDNLEVQVRQEPWYRSDLVSNNSAVAMNVAGDRVGLYFSRTPHLYVNGQPEPLADGSAQLPGGGSIERIDRDYLVSWPDGSRMMITVRAASFLNLFGELSEGRRGQVVGLLGNFDHDPTNDIATREGVVLELPDRDAPGYYEQLYEVFGNSWRITQSESLFDYGPGESTETFTRLDLPGELLFADDLEEPVRRRAEAICRQAGVTKMPFLDDCILDVGMTGEVEFATAAAEIQAAVATDQPEIADSVPGGPIVTEPARGDVVEPDEVVQGEVGGWTESRKYTFDAEHGQVVYFRPQEDAYGIIMWRAIGPRGDTLFTDCMGCGDPGRYRLSAGTYNITVTPARDATGTFRFQVLNVPSPDEFTVEIGDVISDGSPGPGAGKIETPGASDIYRFTAAPGQKVFLKRLGTYWSGGSVMWWWMTDPDGNNVFSDVCCWDQGTFTLTQGGTYTITVSHAREATTGAYSFEIQNVP